MMMKKIKILMNSRYCNEFIFFKELLGCEIYRKTKLSYPINYTSHKEPIEYYQYFISTKPDDGSFIRIDRYILNGFLILSKNKEGDIITEDRFSPGIYFNAVTEKYLKRYLEDSLIKIDLEVERI